MNSFLATGGYSIYTHTENHLPTNKYRQTATKASLKAEKLCSEVALLSGKETWHKI